MTKLKIETGKTNDILRQKSLPVKKVDKEIVKLLQSMEETMFADNGCGLAAPQVGVHKRVIVVLLNQGSDQEVVVPMVNPEIISHSKTTYIDTEGCLSVPGVFDVVERYDQIIVKFLDKKGREQMLKLTDLNARVVQHEVDHLDGILFVDKLVEKAELVLAEKAGKVRHSDEVL